MIVSVDGAEPDVTGAAKFGLRYVHIPIGYDGIDTQAGRALARAAKEATGNIYVHCHHGRHRGPAAAAVVCMAAGSLTAEQSAALLAMAGTSPDYAGLWRDVAAWRAPAGDVVLPELRSSAGTETLAAAMARLDRSLESIRVARKAGWKHTAGPAGISSAQAAVVVVEGLRESARHAAAGYDDRFRTLLQQAEQQALELVAALQPEPAELAAQKLVDLEKSCAGCHAEYRN
jgi:hypothetical protein